MTNRRTKSPIVLRAAAWISFLLGFFSEGLLLIDASFVEEFTHYTWRNSLLELWVVSLILTLIPAITIEWDNYVPNVAVISALGAFCVYSIFKGVYFLGFSRSTHIPCFIFNILCPLWGAAVWFRAARLSKQYKGLNKSENDQCDPLLEGADTGADSKSKPSITRLLGMGE